MVACSPKLAIVVVGELGLNDVSTVVAVERFNNAKQPLARRPATFQNLGAASSGPDRNISFCSALKQTLVPKVKVKVVT